MIVRKRLLIILKRKIPPGIEFSLFIIFVNDIQRRRNKSGRPHSTDTMTTAAIRMKVNRFRSNFLWQVDCEQRLRVDPDLWSWELRRMERMRWALKKARREMGMK